MKAVKVISIVSACVAVVSLSASILMLRQKEEIFNPESSLEESIPEQTVELPPQDEPEQETEPFSREVDYNDPYGYFNSNRRYSPDGQTKPRIIYDKLNLPVYEYVPNNTGVDRTYESLIRRNDDIVGWLRINNTQVNYPLLKDPGDIVPGMGYGDQYIEYNEYYLHHNIDRQYLFEGNIYMDCRDNFGAVEGLQSENIVIYGHNMLNGSQFGNLRYYKDTSYYWSNPFIYLDSIYRNYEYVIVSFCITSGNADTDFRYWDMEELNTQEDFDYYVNRIKRDQLLDTGVDIHYGDKLLTLSTCHADEDNTRFIILARRLRDGESTSSFSTIQKS
ncbi:MAG: class B sortase [Ruminococcus sp.]|nr:class B sortase [Ruminococcus sp.]MDE6797253.1 class B sortase [Ruminococcus sp.]